MKARRPFQKVAIIGLGLMGGSLGLAIKRKKLAKIVAGYARRARTRQQALAAGAVDEVFAAPEAAVRNADLVVLCVPVSRIPVLAWACAPALARGALVTDVGSSKREIVARLEKMVAAAGGCYVGSHPLAGSERQGIEAASARLFEHAVVILTPTPHAGRQALARLRRFWSGLDTRLVLVAPAEHDRLLARSSHLPHLVAAVLAAAVGREQPRWVGRFCGFGFRDTTRIAEGDPEMWRDIVASNDQAILSELRTFQAGVARLARLIQRRDFAGVKRFLHESRERRRQLVRGKT